LFIYSGIGYQVILNRKGALEIPEQRAQG